MILSRLNEAKTYMPKFLNNLRYADDTTLMPESEEEAKSFLVKEESEMLA